MLKLLYRCFIVLVVSYLTNYSKFLWTGAKEGKLKTEYKQDLVTITADMDLNMAGPTINASAVAGHQGWLGGYQMAFDTR